MKELDQMMESAQKAIRYYRLLLQLSTIGGLFSGAVLLHELWVPTDWVVALIQLSFLWFHASNNRLARKRLSSYRYLHKLMATIQDNWYNNTLAQASIDQMLAELNHMK